MKRRFFILLLLLVRFNPCFSQSVNAAAGSTDLNSYITASPLSLIDIHAPRLRAGYIQHISDHWKIGLDLGVGSGTGLFSQRESEDHLLIEARPEVYFILKPTSRTLKYLSAEFFYIDQTSVLLNDEYRREDGLLIDYGRADYARQKYGMHFKFGLFLNLGRHFGLNFYGGVGFRFKTTTFENIVDSEEVSRSRHRHGYETIYDVENSDFRPNPSLGFRLYFRV